jgi:hypothetical protein
MVEAENIVFIVNIYLCFDSLKTVQFTVIMVKLMIIAKCASEVNPAPATIRSVLLRREILQDPTLCSYREGRIESPRLIRDRQTGQCDCPETVGLTNTLLCVGTRYFPAPPGERIQDAGSRVILAEYGFIGENKVIFKIR